MLHVHNLLLNFLEACMYVPRMLILSIIDLNVMFVHVTQNSWLLISSAFSLVIHNVHELHGEHCS
jgi:hypothetical protein